MKNILDAKTAKGFRYLVAMDLDDISTALCSIDKTLESISESLSMISYFMVEKEERKNDIERETISGNKSKADA